jgi:hypothetical protein
MVETLRGEVVHVVSPDELDEYDLEDELRDLAESRYVIVCRDGGAPGLFERAVAFLTRRSIEAVTLIADDPVAEGREVTATVEPTDVPGVYEATSIR